jgi:hypothetical protein
LNDGLRVQLNADRDRGCTCGSRVLGFDYEAVALVRGARVRVAYRAMSAGRFWNDKKNRKSLF